MEKLEINSLEALRKSIDDAINALVAKSRQDNDAWVIAGLGGKTMYAYVGAGNGYMGACLVPCSCSPLVFKSESIAQSYAKSMDYRNGALEPIQLKAMKASSYYGFVIGELEKTIETINSLL